MQHIALFIIPRRGTEALGVLMWSGGTLSWPQKQQRALVYHFWRGQWPLGSSRGAGEHLLTLLN
jgi:hypothetical protein